MGTLTSNTYDVAEAEEWSAYLERILGECRRLIAAGRIPTNEGMEAFLIDLALVLRQVRRDTHLATARGERSSRTTISLSNEEYKRLVTMSESIVNLLSILEMRGAVVLDRTDAVGRVVKALVGGHFDV